MQKKRTRLFSKMNEEELKADGFFKQGSTWVKAIATDEEDDDSEECGYRLLGGVYVEIQPHDYGGNFKNQVYIRFDANADELCFMVPADYIIECIAKGKMEFRTDSQMRMMHAMKCDQLIKEIHNLNVREREQGLTKDEDRTLRELKNQYSMYRNGDWEAK